MIELIAVVIGTGIFGGARWLEKDAARKDEKQSNDSARGMDGFVEYVESKRGKHKKS